MAIMAKWGPKSWEISSQKVAALNGVSATVELDTENSDDKAGSPATKTKALKLQKFTFDFDLAAVTGSDVRAEFESWSALVGQYAPFYLSGQRFGPDNVQLTSVDLSNTTLDNYGRILMGRITINLTEYAEEASSKKARLTVIADRKRTARLSSSSSSKKLPRTEYMKSRLKSCQRSSENLTARRINCLSRPSPPGTWKYSSSLEVTAA